MSADGDNIVMGRILKQILVSGCEKIILSDTKMISPVIDEYDDNIIIGDGMAGE
jgi:hypothetical protein